MGKHRNPSLSSQRRPRGEGGSGCAARPVHWWDISKAKFQWYSRANTYTQLRLWREMLGKCRWTGESLLPNTPCGQIHESVYHNLVGFPNSIPETVNILH